MHYSAARDIELQMQGKLNEIREWYRIYKVAEGKKENTYAFDGECLERVRASVLRCVGVMRRANCARLGRRHRRAGLLALLVDEVQPTASR